MTTGPSSTFERRLDLAAELAVRIASGDLEARSSVSEHGDSVDAVVGALYMLAEELQEERRGRRRAEELLLDEVEAYERAPALFCSLDGDSLAVDSCNLTLASAVGRDKASIVGRSLLELYAPEDRNAAERWFRALPLGASADGGDATLRQASGGEVIVSAGASRIRSHSGRERLRVVFRDVTTERRLESELAQAQKLDVIGRLSGGVAHDINNILSVVTGAAALLSDLLATHSIESEDIALIQQAVARGASLTSDLLAFARRQVIKPTRTDLRAALDGARRMVERLVGEDIRVTVELPTRPMHVLIDGSQLSQVMLNLAINARDAMSRGGRLHVSAVPVPEQALDAALGLPPGEFVRIGVSDTGVGMSEEVHAQAFEPFFTTKEPGKGSGLGLSVCYGIIRQAGGRIVLHSTPGSGTRVEIYLPLTTAASGPAKLVTPLVLPGGRETVLVVEDDLAVNMVTRRVLERAGYRVLAAQNGIEALRVADRVGYRLDVLVSDVRMPGMGGLALGTELRRRQPAMKILFLSGYTENLASTQAPLEARSDFLGKPFTASALLERVRRLLDDPRARLARRRSAGDWHGKPGAALIAAGFSY